MTAAPREDDWTGEDVSVAQIERELSRLRTEAARGDGSDLRTSVMTHVAWVPAEWERAATDALAGLDERHPSRALLLFPEPDAADGMNASLSLRCFSLHGAERHVCSEVIELRLRGRRAAVPASIVQPLTITGLPLFLRWRGEPPWGEPPFEQLVEIVDRLVLDSGEWADAPAALARLPVLFERTAVSDIAWARTLPVRRSLAQRWPGIAGAEELAVEGPPAEAHLLAGWLRSRLGRELRLELASAEELGRVAMDGEEVVEPAPEVRDASDLLSEELDRFGRDPVYEAAVAAA